MTSRAGLLFITALFIGLALHHRLIIKTAPYLVNHILKTTHLATRDVSDHIQLEALQELSSLPLIGQFFIEDKVRALVLTRQWSNVLSQCKKCREMRWVTYENLRPLRAIAQCATLQFLECQQTLLQIKEETPHLIGSIAPLFRIFGPLLLGKKDKSMLEQATQIAEL